MGKLMKFDPITAGTVGKAFGGGREGVVSGFLDPLNLRDKVSGKSKKQEGEAKAKAAEDAAEVVRQSVEAAQGDIGRLFPQARDELRGGFQGALDVFGQSLPSQAQAFQQGNIGAQQRLMQGLPMFQNAILGGNVDFSQMQPVQAQTPDLGFFQQKIPNFSRQTLGDGVMGPIQFPDAFNSASANLNASILQKLANPIVQGTS